MAQVDQARTHLPSLSWSRKVSIPNQLRSTGYIFGAYDRILALIGEVQTIGETVSWQSFSACCTLYADPQGTDSWKNWLTEQLPAAGWTPPGYPSDRQWHVEAYSLQIYQEAFTRDRDLLHALVTTGGTSEQLYRYFADELPRHLRRLRSKPGPEAPKVADVPMGFPNAAIDSVVTQLMNKKRVLVYTGAGISRASGIPPFFGEGSLDEAIPLLEPFPGEALAWMIAQPDALARTLLDFHTLLIDARPNYTHTALAQLEKAGVLEAIFTANIDMLHEAAGSTRVYAPHALEQIVPQLGPNDALLVLGVSEDRDGMVAKCRSAGVHVVIIDKAIPSFAQKADSILTQDVTYVLDAMVARMLAPSSGSSCESPAAPKFPLFDFAASSCSSPNPVNLAIPDFHRLIQHVLRLSTSQYSRVHGTDHWKQTIWAAAQILISDCEADPVVALLFGLLHDSLRQSEGYDHGHGLRAATVVTEMAKEKLIELSDSQLERLWVACAYHSDGLVTLDPTIAVCWDADRIGLWRLGRKPEPSGMSTVMMRDETRIAEFGAIDDQTLNWDQLWRLYTHLNMEGR